MPELSTTSVPHRNHNLPIRRNLMATWLSLWDHVDEETSGREKKFERVKTTVYSWKFFLPGGNWRDKVKIAILQIGHTRQTHCYLMSHGRPPECSKYGESPIAVDHFLFNCRTTLPLRNRLKLPNTPDLPLGEQCPVPQLMEYLQTMGILEEI